MKYLLTDLLGASAREYPDRPALIGPDRALTYSDLDEVSNRIARLLLRNGLERGERVGLFLDKSVELVAGAYGIMKAGGVYVPLDPGAPATRLGKIARDCDLKWLISGIEKEATWSSLMEAQAPVQFMIILNAESVGTVTGVRVLDRSDVHSESGSSPRASLIDQDLAYILYTSGSTGDPKGVMLTHRNAMAFVEWAAAEFELGPTDRVSSHAPLHFDLSVFDLYASASAAAAVVLVTGKTSLFPTQIASLIRDEHVSVWYSVPSILTMLTLRGGLADHPLPSLRVVLFAGEIFPPKYLRELMALVPQARFANLYGPTETNVCTWHEVREPPDDPSEPVPIGVPIPNDEVFVLRDDGQPAVPGEMGELYVRGATVMRGYWGDPTRTDDVLIADPREDQISDPVYKTGDLVIQLDDGAYKYVGRRDNQVKSRGYRIELGDIEASLNSHPEVVECAVLAIPDELFTNRIVAYVSTEGHATERDLVTHCSTALPDYMVPQSIIVLSSLPKTPNGKTDRQTLRVMADQSPR